MAIKLAFSGVAPMAMAGVVLFEDDFGDNPPSDDYIAEIYEMSDHTSKTGGAGSVIVRARVIEGIETGVTNKGKSLTTWLGKTGAGKGGVERQWKQYMLSLGANPQSVEGTFAPDPTIIGQLLAAVNNPNGRCYIQHRMPPIAEGGKVKAEDIDNTFLQPGTYQARKAAKTGGSAPSFGAGGAPAFGAAPGTGAAPAMPSGAPSVTPQPPGLPVAPNGAPGAAMFSVPPAGTVAPVSFGPTA